MAANSWALACMFLSLGQAPSDVLITNQRSLSIPVNIQDARRAELRELVLYASNDQGRTWQQAAAVPPTQNAFTFNAPIDGAYWLRVAVIDRMNKQVPENIYQGPPDQKVVIDTMKPLLRLKSPERVGEEVSLAWELQEDNPDWTTFRLEYQPKNSATAWTPIQATAGLTGQARFRPNTQATITVRLTFKDQAGNQALALADLTGTVATTAFNNPMAQSAVPPAPVFPGVPSTPLPAPPQVSPMNVAAAPMLPLASEAPRLPPVPVETKTFPMNPPTAVAAPWSAPGAKSTVEPGKVVATSQVTLPSQTAPVLPAVAERQLPPLQYVNRPEVTLEYELARVGPSGIGSIELWWTQNDGQSWELYARDPEIKSGIVSNGKHKRTLELPGEGVFGFNLVVKSRAGLGKAPPRAGDLPEIRIEVDTSAPDVKLYEPKADPARANTLLLQWSARDANFGNTPIELEWSEKREGPWHAISTAPLANTGRHSWSLPDRLPVQVYLRLRARDRAGNESTAASWEPQLVDLSEPEGKLLNVSVSPR